MCRYCAFPVKTKHPVSGSANLEPSEPIVCPQILEPRFTVVRNALVRSKCELVSPKLGTLAVGATVAVFEARAWRTAPAFRLARAAAP